MSAVFIYGPPAAGKLTVARELAELTGFKLFDNHTSIEWARSIYELRNPRFMPLLENLRMVVFEEAAQEGFGIIMTFTFSPRAWDSTVFDRCCALFETRGLPVCLVHLTASRDVLAQRVSAAGRAERGKLTSTEGLARFIEGIDLYESIPAREHLLLDSSEISAREAAEQIRRHFHLARAS